MSLKLIIVGDSGIGKTSFINRLIKRKHRDLHVPTVGVDFQLMRKETKIGELKIMLWDTAGQERFSSIVSSYFRGSDGVMLCFSLDSEKSFENLIRWHNQIEENCQPNIKRILVGMKGDLKHEVSSEKILKYIYDNDLDYFVCSSKKDNIQKIDGILDSLITKCIQDKKITKDEYNIPLLTNNEKKKKKTLKTKCC